MLKKLRDLEKGYLDDNDIVGLKTCSYTCFWVKKTEENILI